MLRFFREYGASCPDELGLMVAMLTLPDGNTVVGIAGCYSGDLDAGEAALRPLRSFGSPVADLFRPMPYTEVQKMLDWWAAPQQQHYWKSSFMREMDDAALDAMVHFVNRKPSPACAVVLEFMHGAVQRVAADATALPTAAPATASSCWVNGRPRRRRRMGCAGRANSGRPCGPASAQEST